MSMSLTLIALALPIALTTRAVMGKEKFDNWIHSTEYVFNTNFKDFADMAEQVKAAGYDVSNFLGSPKTHLSEDKHSYFLWEMRNESVAAIFSVYDDETLVQKFISKVELSSGHPIFSKCNSQNVESIGHEEKQNKLEKQLPTNTEIIPTIFTDPNLLIKTLEKFSIPITYIYDNEITCKTDFYDLQFFKEKEQESYDLQIVADKENMKSFFNCLYDLRVKSLYH